MNEPFQGEIAGVFPANVLDPSNSLGYPVGVRALRDEVSDWILTLRIQVSLLYLYTNNHVTRFGVSRGDCVSIHGTY